MIKGIFLAAGSSSRFGSNKLLHPLPCGTPIAIAAARTLLSAVDHSIAVVSEHNQKLAELLQAEGLEIAYCQDAAEGMGKSLACGVAATQHAAGWVVTLADMPYIQPETFSSIVNSLRSGAPIVAPSHQGKRGHPVGFGREFYNELIQLTGDHGARQILSANPSKLQLIPCEDAGILADIDQPSDLIMHTRLSPAAS